MILPYSFIFPGNKHINKSDKNGNLITWPGKDNLNFKNLVGTSLATELGHLDQERKNLRSTKPQTEIIDTKSLQSSEIYLHCNNVKEYNNLPQIRKVYSNQTEHDVLQVWLVDNKIKWLK